MRKFVLVLGFLLVSGAVFGQSHDGMAERLLQLEQEIASGTIGNDEAFGKYEGIVDLLH